MDEKKKLLVDLAAEDLARVSGGVRAFQEPSTDLSSYKFAPLKNKFAPLTYDSAELTFKFSPLR